MSVKQAQTLANLIYDRTNFAITSHNTSELEWLRSTLEEFLELEVEPEELTPADEIEDDYTYSEDDYDEDEDC